ncbi:MAG: adenosylcobinamide-phosphate synthase CbiB [Thermodesulfovibrionales bacterium]
MIGPIDLICAFFLDLAIGDPRWLPHPVRLMGRLIMRIEAFLRTDLKPESERAAGVLLVLLVVIPVGLVTCLIHRLLLSSSLSLLVIISMAVLVYLVSTTIAVRGLIDSGRLVIESVRDQALAAARRKLSMIVGRDTETLSEEGVLRATIETLAENLSDGVIAPVFYLVVGGLPLAMAYKAINTLDSMVGYRNERYLRFGWASARLDDIANYLPARLTGLLIVCAAFFYSLLQREPNPLGRAHAALSIMKRDGRNHTSPNSGMPEAAMAGALGVQLGGPSTYGGKLIEKPYIGDRADGDYLAASHRAVVLVKMCSTLGVLFGALLLGARTVLW